MDLNIPDHSICAARSNESSVFSPMELFRYSVLKCLTTDSLNWSRHSINVHSPIWRYSFKILREMPYASMQRTAVYSCRTLKPENPSQSTRVWEKILKYIELFEFGGVPVKHITDDERQTFKHLCCVDRLVRKRVRIQMLWKLLSVPVNVQNRSRSVRTPLHLVVIKV